jgi:ribosomal protein S18 acetylase RimI-like enzyme
MLRKGKESDAYILARIHYVEFNTYFLPRLGEKFLRLLYLNLLQSDDVTIWIEYSNGQVVGYIVGSKDFSMVFKKIIFKNIIKFFFLISPQLLKNPLLMKNILETFLYSKKEGVNTPKAELVVISVVKGYHRKGLGRKLVTALEKSFHSQKIKEYKVSMNTKNLVANSFYRSLGFKKSHKFLLYGDEICLFIKHIK